MKQLYKALLIMLLCTTLSYGNSIPLFYQLKDSAYRRDIYPHDQTFILELLRCTNHVEPKAQTTYLQAVLKVFTNIAKGAQYISANAFNYVITQVTNLLAPFMQSAKQTMYVKDYIQHDLDMLDRLKVINRSILLNEFSYNFETFRSAPNAFLDAIAEQLIKAAQQEFELQQLRHTIMMFLEIHLNKLIWAPEDQEETWELVKTMAENLAIFVERDILDDNVYLDDLYWTLIHRYCNFLDLTHEYLDNSLFNSIKQDILTKDTLLFELEEQDECLEKRVDCVRTAVMHAEAKKQAHEYGLM